jgi:hypothetical protein
MSECPTILAKERKGICKCVALHGGESEGDVSRSKNRGFGIQPLPHPMQGY